MRMTCIILDDEYLAIQVLQEYASRMEWLDIKKTFTNPVQALAWLEANPVDLLLLDIQMPYIDGITLIEKIKSRPLVVFTTARHDYAIRAFDLDVVDYLVKPVAYERFKKAIEKAYDHNLVRQNKTTNTEHFLTVKSEYRLNKIAFKDIIYIEGLNEYVKLYTTNKTHITLASLKDLEVELHTSNFIRVHKSYIVNADCILSFSSRDILLHGNKTIPVGRLYKNDFLAKMK